MSLALLLLQDASGGGSSALVVGSAVAIALGLVETVKLLISKMGAGRNGCWGAGDRSMLRSLFKWHEPEGGRQEWKNPETRQLLEKILEQLVELNANLRTRD